MRLISFDTTRNYFRRDFESGGSRLHPKCYKPWLPKPDFCSTVIIHGISALVIRGFTNEFLRKARSVSARPMWTAGGNVSALISFSIACLLLMPTSTSTIG